MVVEREKPKEERGYYLHPEAHGKPARRGLRWLRLGDLDRQFQKLDQQAKAMKKRAGPALKVTPPPRSSRSHPPTVKRPDLSRAVVEVGGNSVGTLRNSARFPLVGGRLLEAFLAVATDEGVQSGKEPPLVRLVRLAEEALATAARHRRLVEGLAIFRRSHRGG